MISASTFFAFVTDVALFQSDRFNALPFPNYLAAIVLVALFFVGNMVARVSNVIDVNWQRIAKCNILAIWGHGNLAVRFLWFM